jgi:hypothetical protein
MLKSRGLGAKWRSWIEKVVQGVLYVLVSMMIIALSLNLARV